MKIKFKSKLFGVLLVLIMVLALVPVSALTAFAAEPSVVVTHDVDEIRELLRQDGDVSIKLDADADKVGVYSYDKSGSELEYEDGTIYDNKKVWARIGSGNKTIDLNGHRLYVTETHDQQYGVWKAVLMEIPDGASLTVNDSVGGGKIWFDAEMFDPHDIYYEGNSGLKIRDTFYITGGDLTVNGGEIHAGRAKRVWAFYVSKYDKNWRWIGMSDYKEWYEKRGETPPVDNGYHNWYYTGYATQFNSGTAITAYDGNVTINGGNFWGRGWDNYTIISRVPNNPNGPDDHRDRCAALRVKGGQVTINAGEFYGRSDADAIQVLDPNDLTVNSGTFDVSTNDYLTEPALFTGVIEFLGGDPFDVHMGNLGSFGVPTESINDQSVKVTKGNTMTLSKNAIDPYIVIDDLTLYVNAPLDYSDISTEVYRVPEGCTVESVTWYKNGAKIENPESTYFQKGQRYSVYIALSVNNQTGTKFTNRLNDATINGKEAEINRVDDENLILSVDFGYCTAALEELEFEVIEPAEGQYANSWVDTSEYELYAPVGGYSNYGDFRSWYVSDDGENWTEKSTDGVFEAGKYYRFSFEVHAGEGREFALDGNLDPDVSVTVNGITAATVKRVYDQDPSEHILVQVDFGQCPALISNVELTVTAPKEGETISYNVGSAHDTYYAIGDNGNYTDYRAWYESDTGYDNWRLMSPGDTFTAGKYYKFVTDVYTKPGYEFPTYDNGVSIMPGVNAYINGYAANVSKGYEQDPSRYVTVEYNFGECNDSVVESITITNIDAPVAGQTPDYLANCFGTGYSMASTNSGNWKVNGIVWLRDGDIYTGSIMDKTEKFQAGHKYTVMIDLVPDYGYTFLFNHNNSIYATSSINGNTAQITIDNCSTTKYQVWYTFTCEAKEITTIMLYDLEKPVGGNKPDTSVTPAYPEYYVVESVKWFDIEDNPAGAVFESGVPYYALITVAPADSGVVFADSERMQVYIDGNILDSVEVKNNKVIIPVIIRKPASAPIVNPYVFLTQPQGGTLKVGETLTAYWQTSFIPTQTEIQYWDGEAWDQWDIQQAQAATDSYDFVSVDAGVYRFRIVAYIGSDVVATSNEFAIAWEEEIVNEYIYVYTPGEGNGSNDFDYATNGTEITLSTPESMGFTPIDGFTFDYWSIRKGTAQSAEVAQKQPGDTIIINDNTFIIAMWKDIPHTCAGVKQTGQSATCTDNGWNDYYKCECGKYYEDVTCTKGITNLSSWKVGAGKIVASGHKDLSPKDHKCDVCGANVGTHAAAAGKHTCDYCGKTVTECADANKDHKCDTCGASMGSHAAAVGKHTCDYCGKTVTECADKNSDGKCDVCGKNIGDCVDANKDHKCDKHGEDMGVHESALGKHTCDYCGAKITDCADANKDHKCDTCGTAMGTHTAASGKHTCDYCGAVVTNCGDANKDHKCDTCGASMGNHDAALGKHTCDYCGTKLTDCADVNKDHKCDVCGTVMTNCSDTNNDGKCDVCGTNMGTETEPAETTTKETEPAQTVTNETEPALTTSKETEPSETTTDETVPEQTSAQVTETEETKSPETEANTTEIHQDDGCGATLSPVGIILLFALGSVGFVIFKKKELRN